MENDIFDFITSEENSYRTLPVQVSEGWEWSFFNHVKLTILYKNSQLSSGKSDDKPVKNITLPILRLQYRSEGFDVKDIELFVDDAENYFKSFLVKKFHNKWARENQIDTFIDELVESYVDFGGALVKNVNAVRPEVVPLQRLAFCDQTDLLSGPICEKHNYSPDQLKEMEAQGWGDEKNGATGTIEEIITLSENYKKENQASGRQSKTPGKYIEVYEVHGIFPKWWLEGDSKEYVRQLHIVTFYKNEENKKQGIWLFKGKEKELPYKAVLRDKIYGRALGLGGAEELFEPQVWTTYDAIRIKGMLDIASKIIFQTADRAFANRNKTVNLDNGEILVTEEGKRIEQIQTGSVNISLFERSITGWEEHAKSLGAAYDPTMGKEPLSGTPFSSLALQVQQGMGIHEYRKGKLATFVDEIYRDWIMPYISKEITKGQGFLSELDLDELEAVADAVVVNETNRMIKERILNGGIIYPEEADAYKQQVKDQFMKGGNKRFIEILKDEMKNAPLSVRTNIAGKQANLAGITEKLVNVFRTIISAPQILDDPRMAKLFNSILESSGLSPIDFYQTKSRQIQQQMPSQSLPLIQSTPPVAPVPVK